MYWTKSQTTYGLKILTRDKGVFSGKGIVLLCLRFEKNRWFQNQNLCHSGSFCFFSHEEGKKEDQYSIVFKLFEHIITSNIMRSQYYNNYNTC